MSKGHWKISRLAGTEVKFECAVSGALSGREIERMLERLECRHLSDREIVSASLRKGARGRSGLLDVLKINGGGLMIGSGDQYVARYEKAE